jgi:hypothetical protein
LHCACIALAFLHLLCPLRDDDLLKSSAQVCLCPHKLFLLNLSLVDLSKTLTAQFEVVATASDYSIRGKSEWLKVWAHSIDGAVCKVLPSPLFFLVLEFELRAYTLSHSSPFFFCVGFFLR